MLKFSDTQKNQRIFLHFFALASKKWLKQKIKALDDINNKLGATFKHNKVLFYSTNFRG